MPFFGAIDVLRHNKNWKRKPLNRLLLNEYEIKFVLFFHSYVHRVDAPARTTALRAPGIR
jgi:hypothetical protein